MENIKIVSIEKTIGEGVNNDIVVMTEGQFYETIKQLDEDVNVVDLKWASNNNGLLKFLVVPINILPRNCYIARYCIVKYEVIRREVLYNQAILIELKDLNTVLMELQQAGATVTEVNTVLSHSRTHCIVHEQVFKELLMEKLFITEAKKNSKDKFDVTVYVKDFDKTYTFTNEQEIAIEKLYDLVLVSLIADAGNEEE